MEHLSTVEEVWACHELLRRLNFPAEDIYVEIHKNILVALHQGSMRFTIDMGVPDCPQEEFQGKWLKFIEELNSGIISDERLNYIVKHSTSFSKGEIIQGAIIMYGLEPVWLKGIQQ